MLQNGTTGRRGLQRQLHDDGADRVRPPERRRHGRRLELPDASPPTRPPRLARATHTPPTPARRRRAASFGDRNRRHRSDAASIRRSGHHHLLGRPAHLRLQRHGDATGNSGDTTVSANWTRDLQGLPTSWAQSVTDASDGSTSTFRPPTLWPTTRCASSRDHQPDELTGGGPLQETLQVHADPPAGDAHQLRRRPVLSPTTTTWIGWSATATRAAAARRARRHLRSDHRQLLSDHPLHQQRRLQCRAPTATAATSRATRSPTPTPASARSPRRPTPTARCCSGPTTPTSVRAASPTRWPPRPARAARPRRRTATSPRRRTSCSPG